MKNGVLSPENLAAFLVRLLPNAAVLWKDALPEEVCIVPRKALESLGNITPEMVDYLAHSGANIVESHAWRLRQEQEERDHLNLAGHPIKNSIPR